MWLSLANMIAGPVGKAWSKTAMNSDASVLARAHAGTAWSWQRWMEHLCAAFILQVAHRGTRLELLTGQALLTDHELGVIHDKDDTTKRERQHARLMPWTPAVKQILAAAVECHAVIHQTSRGQAVLIQPDSPLFCKFSQATDRAGDSVTSQAIGLVIQRHFKGAPINVGRSIWVTGLTRPAAIAGSSARSLGTRATSAELATRFSTCLLARRPRGFMTPCAKRQNTGLAPPLWNQLRSLSRSHPQKSFNLSKTASPADQAFQIPEHCSTP